MNSTKIINKIVRYKFHFLILFFSIHQLLYLPKIGSWWDEPYDQLGAKLTIGKIKYLFFDIESNEYRFDFSDHEFFGMFYQLQAFYFSKLGMFYQNLNLNLLDIRSEIHFVYYLRHFYLHIYFCVGIIIIYSLLKKLESEKFAFIYVLVLILIPSINGYSLFDDKDVPFGLHLFLAFLSYTLFIKNLKEEKKISNKTLFLTGLSFGLVLLIRFNGIAFLIFILASLNIQSLARLKNLKFLIYNFQIGLYSLIVFLIGTIQGFDNYYKYLKNLYWQQFKVATWFGETIVNGEVFYRSGDISYIFKIIFYKLPSLYFISLLLLVILYKNFKYDLLIKSSLIFMALFFTAFIVFKPAAYNYERQYLFLFFFLALLVTSGIYFIASRKLQTTFLLILIIFTIYSQSGLGEYKYVYLNEFVNENKITSINDDCFINNNCGQWSTDHLSVSGISMSNMITSANIPVFVCAPYHTVSIFNSKENLVDLDGKYTFKSGVDTMDYTVKRVNIEKNGTEKKVFRNKDIFNGFLKKEAIKEFLIVSEHIITSNGNQCLYDLKKENDLRCALEKENYAFMRNTKITINFMLKCNRD